MSSQQSTQIALYCQGTFDAPDPTDAEQAMMLMDADRIAASGFTTVMLGQWHAKVDENGDFNIYYNDTPYSASAFYFVMNTIVERLHAGGVQYVTMTFGPQGTDFDAITDNLDAFKAIIGGILGNTNLNGLDFDIEANYTDANQKTLADLADWVAGLPSESDSNVTQPVITTASPYEFMEWWSELLTLTSNFAWFNLQGAFFTGYASWITGLPCEASFLLYGVNVSVNIGSQGESTLANMIAALQSTLQTYPNMGGVAYWNYEGMKSYRWGEAAKEGLTPPPS